MIAVLKKGTTQAQTEHLLRWLKNMNLDVHISAGQEVTVLGLVGDTSRVDIELLSSLEIVDSVKRVSEPFKQANRKFHPNDSVVSIGNVKIGGGHFAMIAGPCSVESKEQIIEVAQAVKSAGANILRGGAFKPRTSPYAFQGLKEEGMRLLLEAKKATGIPIITEIMNIRALDLFEDVDIIQVGARNMQNFDMLQELGKTNKPILLVRQKFCSVYLQINEHFSCLQELRFLSKRKVCHQIYIGLLFFYLREIHCKKYSLISPVMC